MRCGGGIITSDDKTGPGGAVGLEWVFVLEMFRFHHVPRVRNF